VVELEALVAQTAALVAPNYGSLDLSPAAGLLLDARYEGDASQLIPFALELTEVDDAVGRDGEQRDLGVPEVDPASEAGRKCEALNEACPGLSRRRRPRVRAPGRARQISSERLG
jgi:hypothetical protein